MSALQNHLRTQFAHENAMASHERWAKVGPPGAASIEVLYGGKNVRVFSSMTASRAIESASLMAWLGLVDEAIVRERGRVVAIVRPRNHHQRQAPSPPWAGRVDDAAGMGELLLPAQVSAWIKRSEQTLARWRREGQGPIFVRVGGRIHYRPCAVRAWLEGRIAQSSRRRRTQ